MADEAVVRPSSELETDKQILRDLVQSAIDVELFTIPLYMTALYSITGRQATTDGSVFPYMGPTESYTQQGLHAQRAYNVIYSVYIQEMLHLQLAMNIANIIGHKPTLKQPEYSGDNTIAGLGTLGDLNERYADVKVELGPLNENSINLFLAIELPDEDSNVEPPDVPFEGNKIPDEFGGIGNLYHAIEKYMAFTYEGHDSKTLFSFCYQEAARNAALAALPSETDPGGNGQIVLVNQFTGQDAYSHMTLELTPGASVEKAFAEVTDMINGIVSEGEGGSKNNNNFVSPNYRPDQSDLAVDVLWDTYSHYARFELVAEFIEKVETWPKWWCANGPNPWTWEDFVADPLPLKQQNLTCELAAQKALAELRASAWNDPSTCKDLNDILNATFNQFLDSLNQIWAGEATTFPMDAMRAISSRVTSVWAANGTPEFKKPEAGDGESELHACQGLNTVQEDGHDIGQCHCATGVAHTCAGTNSCKYQGGCGYANAEYPSFIPGQNDCKNQGGCGVPIPVAQLFTADPGDRDYDKGKELQDNGTPVWDEARTLFLAKLPADQQEEASKKLTPSNVRVILPPS